MKRLDLDQLVKESSDFAVHWFNQHGAFPVMFYIQSDNGQFPLMALNAELDDKDLLAEAVKCILAKENADSYVYVAEAWGAIVKPEEIDTVTSATNHPDRFEILAIYAEDNERHISGQFMITRDHDNRPSLSDFKQLKADMITGRFCDLLPGRKRTRH
jgi:hypothetical protein